MFEVDLQVALCSRKIRRVIEDPNIPDVCKKMICLKDVEAVVLRKILEWAVYNKNEPPVSEQEVLNVLSADDLIPCSFSHWEANFVNEQPKILIHVAIAAYDLHIMGLMLLCAKIFVNIRLLLIGMSGDAGDI